MHSTALLMLELYPHPFPPSWSEAWGDDRYGLWAELQVTGLTQRLRWLPPGQFKMGSPTKEPERFDDEGPQHFVTLTEGLWLADTACTQELWVAVMGGKNPSDFQGEPELPVENVSWDDVQDFLAKLQAHLPAGIEAVLPTEAQWEYACRAGSSRSTPFSFGEQISTDQVNYDGNFPYNNGPKDQYREKTVPVKALPANAWGLYQMHGNVWEWCADAMRQYTEEAVIDPSGEIGTGVDSCALRGGAWFRNARYARSAQRSRYVRGWRSGILGFRFALRSTGQPGAGGPVFDGQSPSQGRDGPVLAARSASRKK